MKKSRQRYFTDMFLENAAADSQNKTSNQWILRTALPEEFRTPDIMGPSPIPTTDTEETYSALYTTIIALISLCGGMLAESRLERFLKRLNADQSVPGERTEKVLARMAKEGYIVKVKDSSSGEERIDYTVGARGKVEVGDEAVAQLVRRIYGDSVEDLDKRLNRSLGISDADEAPPGAVNGDRATPGRATRTRPRRHRQEDDDE